MTDRRLIPFLSLIISITVILVFPSCDDKGMENVKPEVVSPSTNESEPQFSPAEKEYIASLKAKGGIVFGSTLQPVLLDQDAEGRISGFKYDIASAFADYIGVELSMETVRYEELFTRDGVFDPSVKTDPQMIFTPDFLNRVDLLSGFMTIVPWRLKLMDMVPFLPGREILVHRKGEPIAEALHLEGKRIGVIPGTSFEETLSNFAQQNDVTYQRVEIAFDDDSFALVSQGIIDAVIVDSHTIFLGLQSYPNLQAGFPLTDVNYLSWPMEKGNETLGDLVQSFFQYAREEGILDLLFLEYFSMDLDGYYNLIGFQDAFEIYKLNLTGPERERLNQLRADGKLRIATIRSEDNYMPLPDGSIRGFDYMLAERFAKTLGLSLEVIAFDSIAPFFADNGVFNPEAINNPEITYSPDLFEEVDIYCVPFSMTEWREKLVSFVEMYPVGLVLACRSGEEIDDLILLDGRKVGVLPGSSQEGAVLEIIGDLGITIDMVYMETSQRPVDLILNGEIDYAIEASITLIRNLGESEGLGISTAEVQSWTTGWAVAKGDPELESILSKYFDITLADGSFAELWTNQRGVDFQEYMEMVNHWDK